MNDRKAFITRKRSDECSTVVFQNSDIHQLTTMEDNIPKPPPNASRKDK